MSYCPTCQARFTEGQFCPSDGTLLVEEVRSSSDLADPMVGQVVADRFRVLARLGAGGMGTVYRAEHIYIKKIVALKLLRSEITADPEAISRFQREALSASTIGHENIVKIDDFGRLPDGQVYLTMEHLEGRPLNELLPRGGSPPELDFVLDIALQTCHGLAAAHAKGIVHRDMKPENIFVVTEGVQVKILDFGIAKVIRSDQKTNLTKTGAVFGTPNYMAPEQALGRKVDHRSDIYSMGVILYEMLTGQLPFRSDSFIAILAQHVTEPPMPPRRVAPDRQIPEELEALILCAMAKEAEDRFQDMRDLIAALLEVRRRVLGDAPLRSNLHLERVPASSIPTPPPDGSVTTREGPARVTATAGELLPPTMPRPRGKGLVLTATTLGALALASVVAGLVLWKRPSPQPVTTLAAGQPRGPDGQAEVKKVEAVPGPALVDVILDTEPSGAAIQRDGVKIGETPEVVKVPSGVKVSLLLSLPGHQSRSVEILALQAEKKIINLERLGSKTKARRVVTQKVAGKVDRDEIKRKGGKRRQRVGEHGDQGSDHGGEPLDPY